MTDKHIFSRDMPEILPLRPKTPITHSHTSVATCTFCFGRILSLGYNDWHSNQSPDLPVRLYVKDKSGDIAIYIVLHKIKMFA